MSAHLAHLAADEGSGCLLLIRTKRVDRRPVLGHKVTQ